MHLVQQGVELFAAQFGADKAVAHQLQITAELVHRGVVENLSVTEPILGIGQRLTGHLPARFRQLVVAGEGALQFFEHVAELQPVGLQSVSRCSALVDLREPEPIHLERLQQ